MEQKVQSRKKYIWATALLAAWLFCVACAFWWFQFRNMSVYSDHWVSFQGRHLLETTVPQSNGMPLVLHFVDPDCPCSRFSTPHIQALESQYAGRARFIDFMSAGKGNELSGIVLPANAVPAAPAVAIWDGKGQLAYFGPYSGGAVCGEGTDFVAATLDQLQSGAVPHWINHEVVGCFCRWQAS